MEKNIDKNTLGNTVLSAEGDFALRMLIQWGPVCSVPNGEDSHGRAMSRPITPAETVDRAFSIAELAFLNLQARDWIVSAPES